MFVKPALPTVLYSEKKCIKMSVFVRFLDVNCLFSTLLTFYNTCVPNVLQVVWTDEFSTLLTFDNKRIIDDDRIGIDRPYTRDWNLIIHDVKVKDRGRYICQINTQPIKTKPVDLNVLGKLVLSLLRLLHEITNLSILRLDFIKCNLNQMTWPRFLALYTKYDRIWTVKWKICLVILNILQLKRAYM